jgi:hypothetical protein
MRLGRLWKGAGLADDEVEACELLPLLVAARESALRQAGTECEGWMMRLMRTWIVGLERRQSYCFNAQLKRHN